MPTLIASNRNYKQRNDPQKVDFKIEWKDDDSDEIRSDDFILSQRAVSETGEWTVLGKFASATSAQRKADELIGHPIPASDWIRSEA